MNDKSPDSNIVGFPATIWSKVLLAGKGSSGALSLLSRWYRPVVLKLVNWFLRRRNLSGYDPEDVTQEFFVHLLAHREQVLGRADPSRGRFRAWLRTCLGNWLRNWTESLRAQKRGGDRIATSLDGRPDGESPPIPAPDDLDTEFDREWATDVVARATARLRSEGGSGRLGPHDIAVWDLKFGLGGDSDRAIAVRLGISENDVTTSLRRTKRRFREHLRQEVLPTIGSHSDLDEEVRDLLRALGGV
ncbi:MAG: sigma-70 family RNA polymerase sigma factor [Planctomycetota bacterium]